MCHICKGSIKHGNKLCCDDCQTLYHKLWITRYHKVHTPDSELSNFYHELWIIRYHKVHISDSEDSDTFVCHICYKQENTEKSTDEIALDADNDSDKYELYMLAIQQ
jgi:hypothetical protein